MSIEIKNLTFTYNKGSAFEKEALSNVNVTIKKGEFLGLIGHTGSGKSTLIQHFNALLTPTSGQIIIDGQDIHADKTKLKRMRQKSGLVFQYPEHQLFEMTVYKDVAFGPANLGLSAEETKQRVSEALTMVGLSEDIYEKSPFELSGGQKRRVAIAGVLAMRPEILILDEPTAGLDPRGRDEILSQIKGMHEKLGLTVILVSHSMEDVARLVTSVMVMREGKVVMQGSPTEVFGQIEEIEALGLKAPGISYLMKRLKEKGLPVPLDIYKTEDAADCLYNILRGRDSGGCGK